MSVEIFKVGAVNLTLNIFLGKSNNNAVSAAAKTHCKDSIRYEEESALRVVNLKGNGQISLF